MSYYSSVGGSAGFGGAGYYSLSGTYPIRETAAGVRDVQRELQRLGYLQAGSGVYGADGKFGPRTATALRGAAGYVGWRDAPYTPTNAGELREGSVQIPDDLVERLRSAAPNPRAPFASGQAEVPADAPVEPDTSDGSITIGPHLDPTEEVLASRAEGENWVPPLVIGAAVLGTGALIAYALYERKKAPKRNRRRRRRRRTSRRR